MNALKNKALSLIAIAGLTLGLSVGIATPAQADPPPAGDQLTAPVASAGQNPNENVVTDASFLFQQHGGVPSAGTQIHVSVFSCGQFIQQTTSTTNGSHGYVLVNFSPDGEVDLGANEVNENVGPSFEYYIDIVQPGYDAYHYSGSYSGYRVHRPSCSEILSGGGGGNPSGCQVKDWSNKHGQARVGHTVRVSKTKTTNCKVSYKWYVGGHKAKAGKSLRIAKGMKGRTVKMKIVAKGGGNTKKKTLSFGTVRG